MTAEDALDLLLDGMHQVHLGEEWEATAVRALSDDDHDDMSAIIEDPNTGVLYDLDVLYTGNGEYKITRFVPSKP